MPLLQLGPLYVNNKMDDLHHLLHTKNHSLWSWDRVVQTEKNRKETEVVQTDKIILDVSHAVS